MNLPCLNCKADVAPNTGKFFAEVFLCESCHLMAQHFHDRLERELKYLLVIARESIRISLVEGKFSFPEGPAGEPSKRQVLEEILRLEEHRDQTAKEKACKSTPSTEVTPPHVRTLARLHAEAPASSPKDSPRG